MSTSARFLRLAPLTMVRVPVTRALTTKPSVPPTRKIISHLAL